VRLVCIAVALVATGLACAQTPGGGGGGGAGRGTGAGNTPHVPLSKPLDDAPPVTLHSAVQYRLELLEEDLRLQPDQRKAWNAYRERVLGLADDAQRAGRTALGGEMAAPKRLDRVADIARDRLTAIEDIVDAGKNLYAALSPVQQSVADRRLAVPVMALIGVEPANSAAARGGVPAKAP
jgi:hypothetical protein